MAEILDITIDQGSTFLLSRVLRDPLGNPVDLTGYSGRGAIRAKAQDTAAVATFDVGIAPDTSGRYDIMLPADISSAIILTGTDYSRPGVFCYDIELYNDTTKTVVRVLNGKAYISPEVTK